MSEKMPVPTDHVTGMPYLILPNGSEMPGVTNYHHHFFDRRSEHLWGNLPSIEELVPRQLSLEELGGAAVRISRGQVLPLDVHARLHMFYAGPKLPTELNEKFVVAVKGYAGVAPRRAIDLTRPYDRQFIHLPNDRFYKIATSEQLRSEREHYTRDARIRTELMGEFFMRYTLSQGIVTVDKPIIDEFLHTTDTFQRRRKGDFILRETMNFLLDPVEEEYNNLKQRGFAGNGQMSMRGVVQGSLLPSHLKKGRELLRNMLQAA